MTASTQLKVLSAVILVCLVTIAGLGYSTLTLHNKVEQMASKEAQSKTFGELGESSQGLQVAQEFDEAWQRFDRIRQDFFQTPFFEENLFNNFTALGNKDFHAPNLEFVELDDKYKVNINKLDGEEVELSTDINDGVLWVSGKVHRSFAESDDNSLAESTYSSEFQQTFVLDEPVDQAAVKIVREDGKTVIIVPKVVG